MAFGTEIKDFVNAFAVGSEFMDRKRKRDIEEQDNENRLKIAEGKNKLETAKFVETLGLNRDKLDAQISHWNNLSQARKDELAAKSSHWAAIQKAADERLTWDKSKFKTTSDRADRALTGVEAYRKEQGRRADEGAAERKREFNVAEVRLNQGLDIQKGADKRAAEKEAREARKDALAEDPASVVDAESPAEDAAEGGESSESALPTGVISGAKSVAKNAKAIGAIAPAAALPAALAGGLSYLQEHFGLKGGLDGATTGQKDGARRMFEGEGAWTPEEKKAVESIVGEEDLKNGVDPNDVGNRLKTVRTLTRAYELWNKKGNTKMANQMAAGIIQTSRGTAAILSEGALKKLQAGDHVGAGKLVVEAYNQIPDGKEVQYDEKAQTFTIIDEESGKVLKQGEVTPEMVYSVANGFKDGSLFYKTIMDAASRDPSMQDKETSADKAATKAAAKDDTLTPMKPADANALGGVTDDAGMTITNELAGLQAEDGSPLFDSPEKATEVVGPKTIASITELAGMIAQYNGMDTQRAGQLALSIVNPDFTNTQKTIWNFKLIDRSPNVMEIKTEDGTQLRLPARIAGSAIKRGHDGLKESLGAIYGQQNEEAISSAARASEYEDLAKERATSAKRVREGSDTRENTVYGPAGARARITGIPVQRKIAKSRAG